MMQIIPVTLEKYPDIRFYVTYGRLYENMAYDRERYPVNENIYFLGKRRAA